MTDNRKDNGEFTADGGRPTADGRAAAKERPAADGRAHSRRDVLKAGIAVAAAAALPITPADAERAMAHVRAALAQQAQGEAYKPAYFTPDEWKQINAIVDIIIPKDDVSGSATEAGVPQYMDFFCVEYANGHAWMRDALGYFDGFAYDTFHKSFNNCTDAERRQLFDQVAWPAKAKPELREGVNFFNRLRDFTAGGFFSSQMGVKDIGYVGNKAVMVWKGCPPGALKHLGLPS